MYSELLLGEIHTLDDPRPTAGEGSLLACNEGGELGEMRGGGATEVNGWNGVDVSTGMSTLSSFSG